MILRKKVVWKDYVAVNCKTYKVLGLQLMSYNAKMRDNIRNHQNKTPKQVVKKEQYMKGFNTPVYMAPLVQGSVYSRMPKA